MDKNISIVVPAYNSEGSIKTLIYEIESEISKIINHGFEIIIVNDSSIDSTKKILNNLAKKNHNLKIINNKENLGQAASTLIGIKQSKGDVIVTIDDDLQHPPKEIVKLINALYDGDYDFVIGIWSADETFLRNITSFIARIAFNIFNFRNLKNRDTAFRAINKRIKDDSIKILNNNVLLDFKKVSKNHENIQVSHNSTPLNRNFMSFKKRSMLAIIYVIKDTYFKYVVALFLLFLVLDFLLKILNQIKYYN